jgi:DNA modification methylase
MKTFHKIIIGDSRYMKEVPNESVHLIITSPSYWQYIINILIKPGEWTEKLPGQRK